MSCACNQEQRKENGLAEFWLLELASREKSYAFEGIRQSSMGTNCETVVLVHAGVLNLSKYSKWQKKPQTFFFFTIHEMSTFATLWSPGCSIEAHDEKVESEGRFTMTQESIDFRKNLRCRHQPTTTTALDIEHIRLVVLHHEPSPKLAGATNRTCPIYDSLTVS